MRTRSVLRVLVGFAVVSATAVVGQPADAGSEDGHGGGAAAHWTAARMAAAVPRDLVVDHRGLGYLRRPDGTLEPHGHATPAATPPLRAEPTAGPSDSNASRGPTASPGGSDTAGPVIGDMSPAGTTIGSAATFSAVVTDPSGIRSVQFVIVHPNGTTQSFTPAAVGDTWSVGLSGFMDGAWSWYVVAKDRAGRGGNTSTSPTVAFTVDISGAGGGGGGGGSDIVTNAEWTGGAVQTAAGRIYFEMPANRRQTRWNGYVCSGTAIDDATSGRSVIITAAHCVYDDVNRAFARNVLFVPNQANTSGTATDLNCDNDPLGCWEPGFGVVDVDWTTRTFPDNVAWDYAYYVVPDTGAHVGAAATSDALDTAAGSLAVQFTAPLVGDVTHALGYSYSDDPNFMYCAEAMTTEGAVNWWLPSCELSGGSSGGPWVQPMNADAGSGPIISVNSWGYTTAPGMAGPKLSGTSAGCLLGTALSTNLGTVGGVVDSC